MNIKRELMEDIINKLKNTKKAICLYGARQVGKTTLSKLILEKMNLKYLTVNADEGKYIDVLSSRDKDKMKLLLSDYEMFFLDEAQRIPDIGINLKIIVDEFPQLKVIATGSSSFELANKISEPLTGRVWTYVLFPLSISEIKSIHTPFEINNKLSELLVYGQYPEVFTTANQFDKQRLLEEICRSYLYKDVLELATIKHASKLKDLLKLLSFQIGSEVSIHELSISLGLSRDAVERYIDLLEKSFVLLRLKAFSRNMRKEVSKMDKIYFYDLGIRNAIIDNFKPLQDRNDIGQLWENFLIIERQKLLSCRNITASSYFWRIQTGAELDYIEERENNLYGYEFKYTNKRAKPPKSWMDNYKEAKYKLINKENFLDFVSSV